MVDDELDNAPLGVNQLGTGVGDAVNVVDEAAVLPAEKAEEDMPCSEVQLIQVEVDGHERVDVEAADLSLSANGLVLTKECELAIAVL